MITSFGLGVVAGLRTFTAPAVYSLRHRRPGRLVLASLAIGELIADKLPGVPSRTSPPALAARMASGGYVGWEDATTRSAPPVFGAMVGVIGAIAGAYVGRAARLAAIKRLGPIGAGVVEDAIALSLAAALVNH